MESADRPTWSSRAWLTAATVFAAVVLLLAMVGVDGPATAIAPVVIVGLAAAVTVWTLARTRRQRRAYEDRLTTWAAERAAQAERLRIARELHDLTSHGLGLITVRAAATRAVVGQDGDVERRNALADIEQVSRETTTELRRMLTALRTPGDEAAPLRPAGTLADLPRVVRAAHASGVTTELDVAEIGDVSPGVQLAVCAIVGEALANTARHAGPARARVTVNRADDAVVVTVDDDGPVPGWAPQPGAGHGLAGLRERVAVLGGTLAAARMERGFHLTARLPDPERP